MQTFSAARCYSKSGLKESPAIQQDRDPRRAVPAGLTVGEACSVLAGWTSSMCDAQGLSVRSIYFRQGRAEPASSLPSPSIWGSLSTALRSELDSSTRSLLSILVGLENFDVATSREAKISRISQNLYRRSALNRGGGAGPGHPVRGLSCARDRRPGRVRCFGREALRPPRAGAHLSTLPTAGIS